MKKLGILLILMSVLLTACSSGDKTISVIAAASLTEAFTELKEGYKAKYPDQKVELTFAGSQSCATQIREGGGFDVFASANIKYMDELLESSHVATGNDVIFASNKLQIIKHNSVEGIDTLEDIIEKEAMIVLADETVPVGRYTLTMLENLSESGQYSEDYKTLFLDKVVSYETDVKSVATKVAMGEADLGVIYKTDITPSIADKVEVIDLPDEYNVIAYYPIAVLEDSKCKEEAQMWIDYILSEEGKAILETYGFE